MTAWCVTPRRSNPMEEHLQLAEMVRQACIDAALRAYEDAGLSGLCHEGRWESAVDAMRGMHLHPLIQAFIQRCE